MSSPVPRSRTTFLDTVPTDGEGESLLLEGLVSKVNFEERLSSEPVEVLEVMIPEDEVEGFVQGRYDELIILERKIPCREDQVDVPVAFCNIGGVHEQILSVGDAEYLHRFK